MNRLIEFKSPAETPRITDSMARQFVLAIWRQGPVRTVICSISLLQFRRV